VRCEASFKVVRDALGAKAWLKGIIPSIATAEPWEEVEKEEGGGKLRKKSKPQAAVSIAFSHPGFKTLGMSHETLETFSTELIYGMPYYADKLRDTGESAPENWEVGGPKNAEVHMLLMLYAASELALDDARRRHERSIEQAQGSVEIVGREGGSRPVSQKEPFGFTDGISNPTVEGARGNPNPSRWVVRTGEFVLGYLNEYNLYPLSPCVLAKHDPRGILPPYPEKQCPDGRDFGRNGSYPVYRKLQQDVVGFWRYVAEKAGWTHGHTATARQLDETIKLASKCVGRWPSGAPLARTPEKDDPKYQIDNKFTYEGDQPGFACPIGSHVRRTNPRDSIAGKMPQDAFLVSKQHRIMRRAVSFGDELPDFDRRDVEGGRLPLGIENDEKPRGIHFFAINADISRQFNFVQQVWVNNPAFNGLYDTKDPILGDNDGTGFMEVPRQHLDRLRLPNIPRFVKVKGGGYFFMPSITAARYVAEGW
jgi:Dyp-type peroxidase family